MIKTALKIAEKGYIPDPLIRIGIKKLVKQRLTDSKSLSESERDSRYRNMIETLKENPVALVPDKANEQHYEVPPEFFQQVLGKNLKYSCCYYPHEDTSLDEAEIAMLQLTAVRAELNNGMDILELGCGWGSLTLYMAAEFPESRITAVSNSNDQREFILKRAEELGLNNIEVLTRDMNDFEIDRKFDRVVSIEMFEHMRNYQVLLERISTWLKPDGKLFVHIFCHNSLIYPFEAQNDSDWMAKYFFTGGLMPSFKMFDHFQDHVRLDKQWDVSGKHYQKTSRQWLEKMDRNKTEIMRIFENFYGKHEAKLWFVRWRIFFMACEELFGYGNGTEWFVGHYLFENRNIAIEKEQSQNVSELSDISDKKPENA